MKKVKIKNEFLDEHKRIRKKKKKSYRERVKQRMAQYYEQETLKKLRKSRKNNMKETMYIPDSTDVHVV